MCRDEGAESHILPVDPMHATAEHRACDRRDPYRGPSQEFVKPSVAHSVTIPSSWNLSTKVLSEWHTRLIAEPDDEGLICGAHGYMYVLIMGPTETKSIGLKAIRSDGNWPARDISSFPTNDQILELG